MRRRSSSQPARGVQDCKADVVVMRRRLTWASARTSEHTMKGIYKRSRGALEEGSHGFPKSMGVAKVPQHTKEWRMIYREIGSFIAAQTLLNRTPAPVMDLPVASVRNSKAHDDEGHLRRTNHAPSERIRFLPPDPHAAAKGTGFQIPLGRQSELAVQQRDLVVRNCGGWRGGGPVSQARMTYIAKTTQTVANPLMVLRLLLAVKDL